LIVPAKHPLAGKTAIDCQDLVDYPLLLPKSGVTRARLNAWFEMVEEKIQISMELDSTEMMKRFVMAGLGVSFLAVSNCQEEIAAGKLKTIPLAPEPMIRRLGLIYRRDKPLSKAALGFIQIILDNMGDQRVSPEKKLPRLAAG
jgi:DNA-binding transcriptional LysR family regulator